MALSPLASNPDARSEANLRHLHPGAIESPREIDALLDRAIQLDVPMVRGMNRKIDLEVCKLREIRNGAIRVDTTAFERDSRDRVFLSFDLDGSSYFFSSKVLKRENGVPCLLSVPGRIFRRERRSRKRDSSARATATLELAGRDPVTCRVLDQSPEGAGLEVGVSLGSLASGHEATLISPGAGTQQGFVTSVVLQEKGWTRVGLSLSPPRTGELQMLERSEVLPGELPQKANRAIRLAVGGAQLALDRATAVFRDDSGAFDSTVVEFPGTDGRLLRGFLDAWGPTREQVAVIVPPAWGRTKETLMPLAETIVASFRAARVPVCVLRFDGLDKRGESDKLPGCEAPGQDHLRFTFSQGVRDIEAAVGFLNSRPGGAPCRRILVSFSASSIEARRAVATNDQIDGWVCVVGSADLQSMMRSISGGIDYALGLEQGLAFGVQEILGVHVDMDVAGLDALANRLVYMGDARSDMASIRVPVTWIHGRHDAWMDKARVVDALSCGNATGRKFVEVPTGHMLKTSRQALNVFQMIAQEVGEMAGEVRVPAVPPNLSTVKRRRDFEVARLPRSQDSMAEFWDSYLVGRDGSVGYELMVMTSAYEKLMAEQIRSLDLASCHKLLDLGAGVGAFWRYARSHAANLPDTYVGVDLVASGFRRALDRDGPQPGAGYLVADLDECSAAIPVASGAVDGVLASLVLSYLDDPARCLGEIRRVLRAGGRLVLSSLRPDADMSKLFVDGVAELRGRWNGELKRFAPGLTFEEATRAYMNQASRLLDLEEAGRFEFWEPDDLADLVRSAGFSVVGSSALFGEPPQAALVVAVKDGA